jgi:hypothetical protein
MFGWIGAIIGILLILLGGFMVLFFPFVAEEQAESMAITAIITGFVLIAIGAVLVFF